jgi:hypothetical protein
MNINLKQTMHKGIPWPQFLVRAQEEPDQPVKAVFLMNISKVFQTISLQEPAEVMPSGCDAGVKVVPEIIALGMVAVFNIFPGQ